MKLDASQSKQRTVLDQISTTSNMRLDDILDLMNDELTPPLRMRVSTETGRVLNIDAIVVQTFHQESTPTVRDVGHKRKKTLPPINGQIPNFTGATITFPSASGGSITTTGSFGSATYTLTVASGNYIKVGVLINETGILSLVFGTAGASEAAATLPDMNTGAFPIGYIVLNNVGGTIQPLISQNIYQFVGGGGSGGGGTSLDRITQASHGFAVGDVLYLNGSTYTKAVASAANTAEVVGVVSKVSSVDTFELTVSGEITGLTGLTAGGVYFLSAITPGLLTLTEPSVVGQISLPVGVASSATTLYVVPKRGVVVGAANARTTISVANNTATNVVNVTNYNSLKLEGELNVTRSSGGNQRAYYTVEAAKNGAGTWQVSASYTGDDVLYTTLPSWDVASNNLQVTMPLVTNFSSASLTYALNAPAVGATLPLTVDSTALNIVDSAPLSYRNRIINGDMRIDQRNAGASVNPTDGQYVVDRFWMGVSQTSKLTTQRSTVAPAGFTNSVAITSSSAYSILPADYFGISQPIEGFNVADLGWGTANAQTVTLSFWVRSSLTGIFGGSFRNSASNRSYPFSYTINAANTWEQKTITVAGDTSGTWLTDNGAGVRIWFAFGTGSTYSAAAGSWTSGSFVSVTGATSVVGTNGATFYLTGVQLEVGSKASAFERRPYSEELARCLRYYQFFTTYSGITSEFGRLIVKSDAVMRVQPVVSCLTINNGESGAVVLTNPTFATQSGNSFAYSIGGAGNLVWRYAINLQFNAEL